MKHSSYILLGLILGLAIFGIWKAIDYLALAEKPLSLGEEVVLQDKTPSSTSSQQQDSANQMPNYTVEVVADTLFVPWSMVFPSANQLFVSERSGAIRVVDNGELQQDPLFVFEDVATGAEEGLMGLALDPQYQENKWLYACYAYEQNGELFDRVVRLSVSSSSAQVEKTLIENIPAAQFHAGCRLGFGPDGFLYITTGDATDKQLAQNTESLAGKILRISKQGDIPESNPIENSPIFSWGHRNPQGIDWHPESGVMISTEHGPSVFDGPAGGDEINKIEVGSNYGWPLVSHDNNQDGLVAPLIQFTPALAPASVLVYSGNVFSQWQGDVFFGGLKGEGVYRVRFTDNQMNEVRSVERLNIDVGRVRDIVEGPDGYIYFSSSNKDGRGEIQENDDKIYRIVPVN